MVTVFPLHPIFAEIAQVTTVGWRRADHSSGKALLESIQSGSNPLSRLNSRMPCRDFKSRN